MIKVLALFAHPDDAEFLCAGTLALLGRRGAAVHIATMTAGDCGSMELPPARIARIRRGEAGQAARLIGAQYSCLAQRDLLILYDRPTLRKVMELLRRVRPTLVFTHSPSDYMVDHETTSRLCQTACFGAMAPNFRTGARHAAKPLSSVPYLYYAQPFGGNDILGHPIPSSLRVDISTTLRLKEEMLACHDSQRAFLHAQQNLPDLITMARQMAAQEGKLAGCRSAEGFRQHLGQGFPQNDLLRELLGGRVRARS